MKNLSLFLVFAVIMSCNTATTEVETPKERAIGFNTFLPEFKWHLGTEDAIQRHIQVYGEDNHLRLTGLHETQSIDKFSYGVSDRGASIRIPIGTVEAGYKGWLEDRRPASNADPYKVAATIIQTVKGAE